jgi:murein DD-endopeptidase MepM/ murein hydrolase activator NlpD
VTERELELAIAAGAFLTLIMTTMTPIAWGDGWTWPIPDLDYGDSARGPTRVPAEVSQEFRSAAPTHYGVDLMYRHLGAANSGARWYAPQNVPVVAARAGALWSVTRTARGWAVVVDHGPPWATFYLHLATLDDAITGAAQHGASPIAAGQRIGTMGADPLDPEHVTHLHFAAWYRGAGDSASVDPAHAMSTWHRHMWRVPQ